MGRLIRGAFESARETSGDQARKLSGWPKSPGSLSGRLKRLAPNLRAAGWVLEQDRTSKKRSWVIRRSFSKAEEHQEACSADCNRVLAIMDGCRFVRLGDVSPSAVVEWLKNERAAERMGIQ